MDFLVPMCTCVILYISCRSVLLVLYLVPFFNVFIGIQWAALVCCRKILFKCIIF